MRVTHFSRAGLWIEVARFTLGINRHGVTLARGSRCAIWPAASYPFTLFHYDTARWPGPVARVYGYKPRGAVIR